MAKKYNWIIGIGGTEIDDVETYIVHGTQHAVKKHLLNLVRDARNEDPNRWDYGITNINGIDVSSFGDHLYAYAVFSNYHIDYSAQMMPDDKDIKEIR